MSKYKYDCTDCKYGKVDPDKEPCNSCGHDNGNWEPAEITEADTASDADVGSVRRRVLEQAIKCVCTDRNTQYGNPEDSFNVIARLWETYIREKCVSRGADVAVSPEDVGVLMALLKISRIATGVYKDDNYIDAAGYIACAAQCGEDVPHENH